MPLLFGKLAGMVGGIWAKLLVALAIAGAVLAVLAGARRAGRLAERAEAYEAVQKAGETRRDVELKVEAQDDDELDAALRAPAARRRSVHDVAGRR